MVSNGKKTKQKTHFRVPVQGANDGVGCWGRDIQILVRLKVIQKNCGAVEKEQKETGLLQVVKSQNEEEWGGSRAE